MKKGGSDNDDGQRQPDDDRRDFDFGWHDRFGIHLTGLSQGDVKCIAMAIAAAIVVATLVFGFTQVWDRVSTLWQ